MTTNTVYYCTQVGNHTCVTTAFGVLYTQLILVQLIIEIKK